MRKITSFISVIALVLSTNVFAGALCVQGARITSLSMSDDSIKGCDMDCLKADFTRNNEYGLIDNYWLGKKDGVIILKDELGLDTNAGKVAYTLLKAALALGLQVDVTTDSDNVNDCMIVQDKHAVAVKASTVTAFSKFHKKFE